MSRSTTGTQIRKILVLVDGSDNSKRAAGVAMNIAKANSAEVLILNVIADHAVVELGTVPEAMSGEFVSDYYESMEAQAQVTVKAAVGSAKSAGANASGKVVRAGGTVVGSIVDTAAKEKADLIVMGTRGLGGFKKMLMGSVATGVVTHAPCSVLVVR